MSAMLVHASPELPPCSAGAAENPTASPIPQVVEQLILTAAAAEGTAHGADLRDAFRTTRYVLAGCRAAGISLPHLATLLGVRLESIRSRSSVDGILPAQTFATLTGLEVAEIDRWHADGYLPKATADERNRIGYPASALVTALIGRQPSAPTSLA